MLAPRRRDVGARTAAFLALVLALGGCVRGPEARAMRAMDDGRYEEAAREYRAAAEAARDDAELWAHVARAELFAERPWRAREAFAEVARLRPDDPEPHVEIGYTHELERDYDEALEAYLVAESLAPDDAHVHRVTGTRLLRWGQAAAAVPHLARAVELDPSHEETWNALGLARYHADDVEGAERTFRQGLERHPASRPLRLGLAGLLVNARRFAEALAVYDAVVAREPGFAPAHVGRAILLHELGRTREAEAAFARAVEVAEVKAPYRERLAAYRRLLRGASAAPSAPAAPTAPATPASP